MCQIFYTPGRAVPSRKLLKEAADANRHGAGVMWYHRGKKGQPHQIQWSKGFAKDEDAIDLFLELGDTTRAIHFRAASVGGVSNELTHPFPVNAEASVALEGSAQRVIMHNGTWHNWKDLLVGACLRRAIEIPPGPWSDSRAIAFLTHLLGPNLWPILDLESRILVFDAEDLNRKTAPRMFGKWIEEKEGWSHSQDFFRYSHGSGPNASGFTVIDHRGKDVSRGESTSTTMTNSTSASPNDSSTFSAKELQSMLAMMIWERKRAELPMPIFRIGPQQGRA